MKAQGADIEIELMAHHHTCLSNEKCTIFVEQTVLEKDKELF